MRIEGQYQLAGDRTEVWGALLDPQVLADTIPGCRRLESTGPDEYALTVDVGVGAIKGAYRGSFKIADKRKGESCKLSAAGRGAPGSVAVEADARLSDADGGGTVLSYAVEAKVSGALAGVGQRMVAAAAKKTTAEWLSALDLAVAQDEAPVAEAERSAGPPVETAALGERQTPGDVRVFTSAAAPQHPDRAFLTGLATGFALAVAGVLVGRLTARR